MGLKQNVGLAYSSARSLMYFLESIPLPYIDALVAKGTLNIEKPTPELQDKILELLRDLLAEDAKDFEKGYFAFENPIYKSSAKHLARLAWVWADAVQLSFRKKNHNHAHFSSEAESLLQGLPEYYQRNFHFQTDGYLSESSAELYEHQVELLFKGMADPMRRMVLRPLKENFSHDGTGLKILDVACGIGSATKWLRSAFPKAQITGLDLSLPYLSSAKKRFKNDYRTDFIHGNGESLPFKDDEFDIVTSVFLFHELPKDVRSQVIKEKIRVLKPQGVLSVVDSIQSHDIPEVAWSLDHFPREFHEPFFKNYIQNPLEDIVWDQGGKNIGIRTGFYSKSLWATK